MSSKISFEVRRKITNAKVANIDANNFKAAIKEFAETYDMPEIDLGETKPVDHNESIFIAVHDTTQIEFKYIGAIDSNDYVEYKWDNSVEKIKLARKGNKSWN